MNLITTISTKGQVTIPQYHRDQLGIKTGDKVLFKPSPSKNDEIILKIIPTQSVVAELGGSLHSPQITHTPIGEVRNVASKKLAAKYSSTQ